MKGRTSDIEEEGMRRRRKFERDGHMRMSWRARQEQARIGVVEGARVVNRETASFRNACRAESTCGTLGQSFGVRILNKDDLSRPWMNFPGTRGVFH